MPQPSSTALPPSPEAYRRKRWTRQESRALVREGLLEPGRFELLDGDIIFKVSQNPRHVFAVTLLLRALVALFGFDFVQTQAPVAIDDTSEPEPDAAVTARPLREYLDLDTPTPAEIRMVAEVSDATLRGDTTVKAQLYGRAGIPEYWVIDLVNRTVLVHRRPGPEGYEEVVSLSAADTIHPLSAPDASVEVANLLP